MLGEAGEGTSFGRLETQGPRPGGPETGRCLQRDGGGGKGEELVKVRWDWIVAAQQGVKESHGSPLLPGLPRDPGQLGQPLFEGWMGGE